MRVLIAERSASLRHAIAALARELKNVQVIAVADPPENAVYRALELWPDVLIVGIQGVSPDGLAPLQTIPALMPGLKVIVVTGQQMDSHRRLCHALGPDLSVERSEDFNHITQFLLPRPHAADIHAPR